MAVTAHRNALQPGYELHWYGIKKILGQGGFGITYLAQDSNLHQGVAIKEYLPVELAVREGNRTVHPISDKHREQFGNGLKRFLKEARTLAKFRHPNVVRVLSVFEENNTAYMVMEYERGQSLEAILDRRGTLREAELQKIVFPILDGLELIHKAGFIHRDIKPGNVYIRVDETPVLLDFGSARQAVGSQADVTSMVSPGYAPFEQYSTKSDMQGPWTDIYAMGATLDCAVTGEPPLDAVDRSQDILMSSNDDLSINQHTDPGKYSQRLLVAIDHALRFNYKLRPQTIGEWRAELLGQTTPQPRQADEELLKVAAAPPGRPADSDRTNFGAALQSTPATESMTAAPVPAERSRLLVWLLTLVLLGAGGWYAHDQGWVAYDDWLETVKTLIPQSESDALSNADALIAAAERGDLPAVRELISQRVDLDAIDANGWTALMAAALQGDIKIVQALLAAGADPNAAAPDGTTALMAATFGGAPETVAVLLEQNADLTATDAEGIDALTFAERQGYEHIAALLSAAQDDTQDPTATKIALLVAKAKRFERAGQLVTPLGTNALAVYQEILQIQPDSQQALGGIRELADLLVGEAREAVQSGDVELANTLLDAASAAAPGRDSVKRLRQELSAREREARLGREAQRQQKAVRNAELRLQQQRARNKEAQQAAENQQQQSRERLEQALDKIQ